MRNLTLLAGALAALSSLSCGEDPAAGGGAAATELTCLVDSAKACTSYSGEGAEAYEENCTAGEGVWSTTACPTAALCGKCSFAVAPLSYVNHYYEGGSIAKADLETLCDGLEGTWTDQAGVACD